MGACHNELLMLEHGEVQSMLKLRATSCLFSAIEHTHDAVEITSLEPEKPELHVEVPRNNPILACLCRMLLYFLYGNGEFKLYSWCSGWRPASYLCDLRLIPVFAISCGFSLLLVLALLHGS